MKQDKELIHFHNSLWASALSGLSGTSLFWWWEQLDVMDAYHHYRPLSAFLADVPFTTADLHHASVKVSEAQVRVVGLQGNNCAYLWISNSQAKWSNKVIDSREPNMISGATLNIEDLSPGPYQIQWWDTYKGKILEQGEISVSGPILSVVIPDFARDIACKVEFADPSY
jgi:hypothetical protein